MTKTAKNTKDSLTVGPAVAFKPADLDSMKRADRKRAERELEYSKRDVRYMLLVVGLTVALIYTSLWLISVVYGG